MKKQEDIEILLGIILSSDFERGYESFKNFDREINFTNRTVVGVVVYTRIILRKREMQM